MPSIEPTNGPVLSPSISMSAITNTNILTSNPTIANTTTTYIPETTVVSSTESDVYMKVPISNGSPMMCVHFGIMFR